jgi:GNAT superfamily N-acetyltransferase
MIITLKKVSRDIPEFDKIKNLYSNAFPEDEKAPFSLLYFKRNKDNVDFFSIHADGEWVGFAYAVSEKDVTYLFYFAIDEEVRGKGYGSAALKALIKHYEGQRFFLALEQLDESADNFDERIHRRHFYARNGLRSLDCRLREGKVVYDVMGVGGKIEPEEYGHLMSRYMGSIFTKIFHTGII